MNDACTSALHLLHNRGTAEGQVKRAQSLISNCNLPPRSNASASLDKSIVVCDKAVALLSRTQPSILSRYLPVSVGADGNCLFRSVSLSLFGNEDCHLVLRALTAVPVCTHPERYDASAPDCVNPLLYVKRLFSLCTVICVMRLQALVTAVTSQQCLL